MEPLTDCRNVHHFLFRSFIFYTTCNIRAAWTKPSPSAYKIIGFYGIYTNWQQRPLRGSGCVGWSGSSMFIYIPKTYGLRQDLQDCSCTRRRHWSAYISCGSESSKSVRSFESLATHRVPWEDSDQTAWMRKLICVFAGRTYNLVGKSVPQLNPFKPSVP